MFLPASVKIFMSDRPVDMRRGIDGPHFVDRKSAHQGECEQQQRDERDELGADREPGEHCVNPWVVLTVRDYGSRWRSK